MKTEIKLPRILVIDDLFGRQLSDSVNGDRENLCASFLLKDVSRANDGSRQRIKNPIAEAVFSRGQLPACAVEGDTVENDLSGTLETIRSGWGQSSTQRWAMVLLDLCFYTGKVTGKLSAGRRWTNRSAGTNWNA